MSKTYRRTVNTERYVARKATMSRRAAQQQRDAREAARDIREHVR